MVTYYAGMGHALALARVGAVCCPSTFSTIRMKTARGLSLVCRSIVWLRRLPAVFDVDGS
jgi:hypothetical protein